ECGAADREDRTAWFPRQERSNAFDRHCHRRARASKAALKRRRLRRDRSKSAHRNRLRFRWWSSSMELEESIVSSSTSERATEEAQANTAVLFHLHRVGGGHRGLPQRQTDARRAQS